MCWRASSMRPSGLLSGMLPEDVSFFFTDGDSRPSRALSSSLSPSKMLPSVTMTRSNRRTCWGTLETRRRCACRCSPPPPPAAPPPPCAAIGLPPAAMMSPRAPRNARVLLRGLCVGTPVATKSSSRVISSSASLATENLVLRRRRAPAPAAPAESSGATLVSSSGRPKLLGVSWRRWPLCCVLPMAAAWGRYRRGKS